MGRGNQSPTIEAYLEELGKRLQIEPLRLHRALQEAEDHLRESKQAGIAAGLDEADAERQALERFGSAREVAARFNRVSRAQLLRAGPDLLVSLYQLAVLVLISVGLSGVLSWALGAGWGKDFVAGDGEGIVYSAERCSDFFGFHPEAASCREAATAHHFEEVVGPRLAAGLAGLLAAGPALLLRLRWPLRGLDPGIFATAVATVFGVASAGFFLLSAVQLATGTPGAGADLSSGLATGLAFLVFAPWSLLYLLRVGRHAHA